MMAEPYVRFRAARTADGTVVVEDMLLGHLLPAPDAHAAVARAAELNVGQRHFDPPRAVLIRLDVDEWWPGTLDHWSREFDDWFGRAKLDHGANVANWYPRANIKPQDDGADIGP